MDKEYSEMCKARFNENESQNPNGSGFPFVRFSKDMKWVEIVVIGIGPVHRKQIGTRDPDTVFTEVKHKSKEYYKFPVI
jgi:hypothetical protein